MSTFPHRPLRLGVVGLGKVAQSSHLPTLALLKRRGWDITVVALADPDSGRVEAAYQTLYAARLASPSCGRGGDGAALLDGGGIDAALFLTTPAHTPALISHALRRGIPVLAEKPGGSDAATFADLVAQEARAVNPFVRIAYNRHSVPLVPVFLDRLREIVSQSAPGTVHAQASLWRVARTDAIFYDDTMPHALDFLQWSLAPLVPPLRIVQVKWWPAPTDEGLPSGLRATFHAGDDAAPPLTAALDVRPAVGRERETYEVTGAGQTATLDYPPADGSQPARLVTWQGGRRTETVCPNPDGGDDPAGGAGEGDDPTGLLARGFAGQLAHFLRAVAGDTSAGSNLATLAHAYETARLREAIRAFPPV